MASSLFEPSPRFSHFSAAIGEQVYVYGGRTKDFSAGKSELGGCVHCFKQCTERWQTRVTRGKPHPGLYDGACTDSGKHLYLYGGGDGSRYQDSLYQLDTDSLEWSQLPSGPTRKIGCGMVSYPDKLILFGGYGNCSCPTQQGATFTECSECTDEGWTNELHMFDMKKEMWFSPQVTGTRPPPCCYFSLTIVDDHHAVLFGGRGPNRRSNHVYILDLISMHWSKLDKDKGPWPVERSGHAAVCLWNGEGHSQLLITGGVDENDKVLSDAWLLDLQAWRWREVDAPGLQARCGHSGTAFNSRSGLMEVTLFGGCPQWPSNYKTDADLPQIAKTTVLRLEYQECPCHPTRKWTLTGMADSTPQLGTRERIEEKAAKMGQTIPTSLAKKRNHLSKPRKKFSILVQGIEECECCTTMPTRQKKDLANVLSVLSMVDNSIHPQAIRDHHRLGKYNQARQRPRPILVQFFRSSDVSSILSKTSAVKPPYSIQHYMTPTELAPNKILLKKRWAIHTETGTDLKLIKIRKYSIFVKDRLHGTLNTITDQYVPSHTNI